MKDREKNLETIVLVKDDGYYSRRRAATMLANGPAPRVIPRRYFTPSLLTIFRHPSGAVSEPLRYDSHSNTNLNIFMYKFLVSQSFDCRVIIGSSVKRAPDCSRIHSS